MLEAALINKAEQYEKEKTTKMIDRQSQAPRTCDEEQTFLRWSTAQENPASLINVRD